MDRMTKRGGGERQVESYVNSLTCPSIWLSVSILREAKGLDKGTCPEDAHVHPPQGQLQPDAPPTQVV